MSNSREIVNYSMVHLIHAERMDTISLCSETHNTNEDAAQAAPPTFPDNDSVAKKINILQNQMDLGSD